MSVALGIGANTAIFSILDSLVLKSLPVPRPDRLVQVTPGGNYGSWTYPLWERFRDSQNVLEGVFAWSARAATFDLSAGAQADRVNGLWVSASFFEVLGVPPALGRTFVAADDTRGGGPDGPVAVISHSFWQRRFAGAVDVIGHPLSIEGIPFTIVGVAPAGFLGPNVGSAFDVAVPDRDPTARPPSRSPGPTNLVVADRDGPPQTGADDASGGRCVGPAATHPP